MAQTKGISDSYSLEEAINDAIGQMPDDPNPYPDKLYTYRVDEIGAEKGGIAGFDHMYVMVTETTQVP